MRPFTVTATDLTSIFDPEPLQLREVQQGFYNLLFGNQRDPLQERRLRELALLQHIQLQRATQRMPCGNLELTIAANVIDSRSGNLITSFEFRQNIPLINGEQRLFTCRVPVHIRVPHAEDNTYEVRDVTAEAGPDRQLRRITVLQPRDVVPLTDREIEGRRLQQQGARPTFWRLNDAGISEPIVLSENRRREPSRERSRSRDRR